MIDTSQPIFVTIGNIWLNNEKQVDFLARYDSLFVGNLAPSLKINIYCLHIDSYGETNIHLLCNPKSHFWGWA